MASSRAYYWYVAYFQVEGSIEKAASTSHRIPTLNPLASGVTPWNKDRKPLEKRKSAGVLIKRQYQRTTHILNKIVKNKVAGIADEQVENMENQQNAKPTAFKRDVRMKSNSMFCWGEKEK